MVVGAIYSRRKCPEKNVLHPRKTLDITYVYYTDSKQFTERQL